MTLSNLRCQRSNAGGGQPKKLLKIFTSDVDNMVSIHCRCKIGFENVFCPNLAMLVTWTCLKIKPPAPQPY
jgi:hypothetical protein